MKYLIIGAIILIVLTIIILMFLSSKNKFIMLDIKLKEAENSINLFLQKKAVCLNNLITEINKKKKNESVFEDFVGDIDKEKDSFKLHTLLSKYYNEVSKLLFDDDSLNKNKKIISLLNELKDNEEDLIGSIKFYNDTVVDNNGLLKVFPYKFFSKLISVKELPFYNNEKEEMFDILKQVD